MLVPVGLEPVRDLVEETSFAKEGEAASFPAVLAEDHPVVDMGRMAAACGDSAVAEAVSVEHYLGAVEAATSAEVDHVQGVSVA